MKSYLCNICRNLIFAYYRQHLHRGDNLLETNDLSRDLRIILICNKAFIKLLKINIIN